MAPKTLPSRELLRQLLDYDPTSGEFRWLPRPREMFPTEQAQLAWNGRYAKRSAGGFKKHGYLYIAVARHKYLAHRLAWLIHHGEPVPDGIDHSDGNSWNNSIGNLRAATQSQNCANAQRASHNRTGVKGVGLMKNGKFRARIWFQDRDIHVGEFFTLEEAAKARQDAATRLHGTFARL
jgi:HNH endonuclease